MNSLRYSTLLLLCLLASHAATTMVLVSSYTFDPLNNSWKPSAARKNNNRSHHSSSSASSYSYAPAEPIPSAGVQFAYNEEDVVRHHYTAWGVGGNGGVNSNDPSFIPKETLVEIQYNKRTGEISLFDEDGVVTPEEYKRLIKAVKYSNEEEVDCNVGITASMQRLKSQEREEDVAVGTTHYVDPEDLDPIDIIDTEGQDLLIDSSPAATGHQRSGEAHDYTHQLQDYHDISTQYHQPDTLSSSISDDSFNSYDVPAPTWENNYPVPNYQHYQYSKQPLQNSSAVAGPTIDDYYKQQQSHQHQYTEYYTTAVAEQSSTSTNDEIVEHEEEATYRSSRGFGFAHRRDFFTGSN